LASTDARFQTALTVLEAHILTHPDPKALCAALDRSLAPFNVYAIQKGLDQPTRDFVRKLVEG
jgi:hypothetical protein